MNSGLTEVKLRRYDTSTPWGFRIKGGAEQCMPLYVETVSPKGLAASQGVRAGDIIIGICNTNVTQADHAKAKQEILRAGNDLDLLLQRGQLTSANPQPVCQPGYTNNPSAQDTEERVQIVEEPTPKFGGPTFKNVKPKTYQVLEQQLPSQGSAPGAKPASIFDRKKQERSAYLNAHGNTIQKAYGEQ